MDFFVVAFLTQVMPTNRHSSPPMEAQCVHLLLGAEWERSSGRWITAGVLEFVARKHLHIHTGYI